MKKFALLSVPLLLVLALGIAGCGKQVGTGGGGSTAPSGTVEFTTDNFAQHAVTIKAGEAVHFNDTASGGTHVLCLGTNEACDKSAKGPQALQGDGFTINIGETKDVVFDTAGTYQITCSIHPNMNLTVTVQ